ncbi:cobalamin-dependent protein [Patescibacteria group bacterium]|nr:cobalamin-dependent protein [Patescibacteria group bacterium]
MKILLVNPTSALVEKSQKLRSFFRPILPFGIASIAAVLEKAGIEVKAIDQFANKMNNKRLLDEIKKYNPGIIGFSCLTPTINNVKVLVNQIRGFSNAPIALGGIHATIFAEELLGQKTGDIIVRGEGEVTTLELALAIKKKGNLRSVRGISFLDGNSITHNPDRPFIRNLDELPYPAWHLFDLRRYTDIPLAIIDKQLALPILGSRGCAYRCSFCAQDKIYPRPNYRKSEDIIKELEYMCNRYDARYFGFFDTNFPFSIEFGLQFCRELIQRGLHKKIKWCTETRVDLVNEELLLMMKRAGVHLVMFGLESGNQAVLDRNNKGTTLEQARRTMRIVKKSKIYTLGSFILGLPGETKETCEETIKFAKELNCDVTKFNLAVPYPGSKFFEDLFKNTDSIFEPEKFTSWHDWADCSGNPVYVPCDMDAKDLLNFQRKAMCEFYLRPKVIISYLRYRKANLWKFFYGGYVLINRYILYLLSTANKRLNIGKN